MSAAPILAFSQGDPCGVGPELLLRLVSRPGAADFRPLLFAEQSAFDALRTVLDGVPWERLVYLEPQRLGRLSRAQLEHLMEPLGDSIPVVDVGGRPRAVRFGEPTAADARSALEALDLASAAARRGLVDGLVTAPINKQAIAGSGWPSFRGHTDYLAQACGLERYGRDYLMAFLAPQLRVALLSTHVPLREAIESVTERAIVEALACLSRQSSGTIAVAGLNPHAGEAGLIGDEEIEIIGPAIARAREQGVDVVGPESPDTVFYRARSGEFDWVLALYHDQGLIATKTLAFGAAANVTLGLPYLRTSVDHGTAYDIAGLGRANASALERVVEITLELVSERRALAAV